MLDLSAVAKLEKNKVASTGAWLVLLEIQFQGATIRIGNNTENITWDGQEWIAFPFTLGEVTEDSKGELPQLTLKVSNITRSMQQYVEQYAGGTDAIVILRVVHSEHLDMATPEIEEYFQIKKTNTDAHWVTFTLGPDFTMTRRLPERKFMKNFCPFQFKGIECGYNGAAAECNKTLGRCRELKNSVRFGGEPGIPGVPTYV